MFEVKLIHFVQWPYVNQEIITIFQFIEINLNTTRYAFLIEKCFELYFVKDAYKSFSYEHYHAKFLLITLNIAKRFLF